MRCAPAVIRPRHSRNQPSRDRIGVLIRSPRHDARVSEATTPPRNSPMQVRGLVLALAATIVVAACGDDTTTQPVSKILNFRATLSPANEPGTLNGNPAGSGTFTATLDTSTNVFTWTGSFTGLTSNINNGHIHGPFVVGGTATTAGVLLNFDPANLPASAVGASATFVGKNSAAAGSVSGTITLNTALSLSATVNGDSLRKLILANATY